MKLPQVKEILKRYGQTVTIPGTEGDLAVKAFLQPVTERSEGEPFVMTELGSVDDRLWLYLGVTPLEAQDTVVHGTRRFRVRSCRPFHVGEEVIYWWAMLETQKEAAE